MWYKILPIIVLAAFSLHADFPSIFKQKASRPKEVQNEVSMCIESQAPKKEPVCEKKPICEKKKDIFLNTENACNCSILFDLLYWKPVSSDLIIGWSGAEQNSSEFNTVHKEIGWGPGGRLGVTFSGIYDWTIGLIGTYYQNKTSFHTTMQLASFGMTATDTVARNKATYTTVDLNFSSKLILNKTLSISPLIGARAVLIKEKVYLHYLGERIGEHDDRTPSDTTITIPMKFLGYGPQIGLVGFFKLGDTNLEFFGSLATSLAYGKNSSSITFYDLLYHEGSQTTGKNNFNHLKASLQLVTGMQYKYHFEDSNFSLGFHLDYEANLWWDINSRLEGQSTGGFSVASNGSNFTLHGANFGILFDF